MSCACRGSHTTDHLPLPPAIPRAVESRLPGVDLRKSRMSSQRRRAHLSVRVVVEQHAHVCETSLSASHARSVNSGCRRLCRIKRLKTSRVVESRGPNRRRRGIPTSVARYRRRLCVCLITRCVLSIWPVMADWDASKDFL